MKYIGSKVHIDLNRLENNYNVLSKDLHGIPIMATVKANAYGHGAVEISKTLERIGVRYLAVFTIEEGIELREADIKTDILIYSKLNHTALNEAKKYNLTLNISSFEDLDYLRNFEVKSLEFI